MGLSIGVVQGGHTFIYNIGTLERGKPGSPASDTLYQIASISKTFTGTLLAQAALEKKISLNDDVRKYIEGSYPNLEYQGHPIELQFLVNHNSGLPFNLPDIPENRPPFTTPVSSKTQSRLQNYQRKDFLKDLHGVEIKSVPGKKFSYSNVSAILLSIVLERIYGMPYDQLVKQKIATPLGMKDTTITMTKSQKRRLARGYDEKGGIAPYPTDLALGAAGLRTTAADLVKYARWELHEDDPVVRLTHEPRFILTPTYSLGLNWQIDTSGKYRRVNQDGSVPGFLSNCTLFPELNLAVIVLANEEDTTSSQSLGVMADQIAKALQP